VSSGIRIAEIERRRQDRALQLGRVRVGQPGDVTGPLVAVAFTLLTLVAFLVWLLVGPPLPDWIRSR